MVASKEGKPQQHQCQQLRRQSPGKLGPEIAPPVIAEILGINHARNLACALHHSPPDVNARQHMSFIPGFRPVNGYWLNLAPTG